MKSHPCLVAVLLAVVLFSAACGVHVTQPSINTADGVRPVETNALVLRHVAWIPMAKDDNLEVLFRAVDAWVDAHPEVDIMSVDIVNATEVRYAVKEESYTKPSGALIVYRKGVMR